MKLKDLPAVVSDSRLNALFAIGVERAAYAAIAPNSAADQPMKDWATRVIGRAGSACLANWYANRVIKGSILTSTQVQALIDAATTDGTFDPEKISLPDNQFSALIITWAQQFAALGI